jgi:hypothetical protein
LARRSFHGDNRVQKSPRVAFAGTAVALVVDGAKVGDILSLPKLHLSRGYQCTTEPGSSCWKHTVEHVYSKGTAHNQIQGKANTHQVARLVFRQNICRNVNCSPKLIFALASTEIKKLYQFVF